MRDRGCQILPHFPRLPLRGKAIADLVRAGFAQQRAYCWPHAIIRVGRAREG
jgi:hypothetical protein